MLNAAETILGAMASNLCQENHYCSLFEVLMVKVSAKQFKLVQVSWLEAVCEIFTPFVALKTNVRWYYSKWVIIVVGLFLGQRETRIDQNAFYNFYYF